MVCNSRKIPSQFGSLLTKSNCVMSLVFKLKV